MSENRDARPVRLGSNRVFAIGDEAMVYEPESRTALALNVSAAAILELCDGEHTVTQIGQELARLTGVTPGEILPDVERMVTRFRELGLVETT